MACLLSASSLLPAYGLPLQAVEQTEEIQPVLPASLQDEYTLYEPLSDEFNGSVSDMWLMDYMPWWSDTAKREKSGTRTRYRFIEADTQDNQSLQIYVSGENVMNAENFQPYYLEKLSGPRSLSPAERYLCQTTSQKNTWNSKFAGFMAAGKDYLNTYRGSQAPIENHQPYSDAGATQYGYFETRCKFLSEKRGQGLAPAFWFIGVQDGELDRGEVDVFEFLDNHTLDFTIHPKGDTRMTYATKEFHFEEDMSADYHTYGLLWDETGFSLYVDGEFLWKHNIQIDYRMIPMFSINHHENGWIGSVDNKGLPEERTFDIDYFRVFKKKGTDPDLGTPVIPQMEEGRNMSDAAWISLFGLTGTEADATPMQWLNDQDLSTTVKSGLKNSLGETISESVLPQYVYIDWKTPADFNTIVMHCAQAQSMAPTLVDVEISEDGETWTPAARDIALHWTTDSQVAESQTIMLENTIRNNRHCRLVIRSASLKNGQFGISELEIGENITASAPDYLPLPENGGQPEESLFGSWSLDGSLAADRTGLDIIRPDAAAASWQQSQADHGQALRLEGLSSRYYLPLQNAQTQEHLASDEDFTLSLWIRPDAVSSGTDQLILAQQTGSAGGRPWLFLYQGKLGCYLGAENNYADRTVQAGVWTHAAVTFHVQENGKALMTLYQNGEKAGQKEVKVESDSLCSPQLLLGSHKSGTKGGYKGLMDDIVLYRRALSEEEMKALYTAGGTVDSQKDRELTGFAALEPITGTAGLLQREEVTLPETVTAVFENQYAAQVPVHWNTEDLDALDFETPGTLVIRGEADLSSLGAVCNENHLQPEIRLELRAPVSLSELSGLLETINALQEADWTEESFAAFLVACQNVQTKNTMLMIGQYPDYTVPEIIPESATADTVRRMSEELQAALDLLVPVQTDSAEKLLLQMAMQYAREQQQEENYAHVHPVIRQGLENVLEQAETLLVQPAGDPQDLRQAWLELTRWIHLLDFRADKAALEALIAECDAMDLQQVIRDEAWKAYQQALDAARQTAADENALQERIDAAAQALLAARESLHWSQADLRLLQYLVSCIRQADLESYAGGAHKEALILELAKAEAVLASPESQEQVDAQTAALNQAWLQLRLKPSEVLLQELHAFVQACSQISLSLYQAEDQALLQQLYTEALQLYSAPDASQEAVQSLLHEIQQEKVQSLLNRKTLDQNTKQEAQSTFNDPLEQRNTNNQELRNNTAVSVRNAVSTSASSGLFPAVSSLLATIGLGYILKKRNSH